MAGYNQIITRDGSNDPLVPTPVAAEVIKELPKASAVMSLARRVPMSTKTSRMPVFSVLPEAYFVSGDTGLKQTDKADWENVTLVAEELAVIVPIPEAYLADAQVPIWDQVRPAIAEAFGRKIDLACLFGVNLPGTWSTAIVPAAVGVGNVVQEGDGVDLADDIAGLGETLAEQGVQLSGFAAAPATSWRLRRLRDQDGAPIYQPLQAGANNGTATLYGYPLPEIQNGGWMPGQATVIGGDWRKAIFGVRQDITFRVFTEGAITDDDGKVVLNLMQQDSVALRCVMRCAFATANPVNPVEPDKNARYPFAVLQPAGSS